MTATRRAVLLAVLRTPLAGVAAYAYLRAAASSASFRAGWRPIWSSSAPTRPAAWRRWPCAKATRVGGGALLFALDADLQRAAVAENEAAVVNARAAYERAKSC